MGRTKAGSQHCQAWLGLRCAYCGVLRNRFDHGRQGGRLLAIGEFEGIAIIAVVFRPLGSEALSAISMRRASKTERTSHD